MKTLLKFMYLGVIVIMAAACSSDNTPESVALDFTTAVYTGNFEKAKSYCTDDSKGALDLMMAFVENSIDKLKATSPEVKILKSEIEENGNKAKVELQVSGVYDIKNDKLSEEIEEETVDLIKVDDQWKVEFTK